MLFALCVSAQAQRSKKVPRIGYLSDQSLAAESTRIDAFRQGLRDLGYVDGKDRRKAPHALFMRGQRGVSRAIERNPYGQC
jgi:hypothetical protein